MSQLVTTEMPPPPPPLADIKSATESAQGTIGKGLAASTAQIAESRVQAVMRSDDLSFSLEGEASMEVAEDGRLDSLSIQDFVAQYNFNTEGLERVVFELEEAGRLDQVICIMFLTYFRIYRSTVLCLSLLQDTAINAGRTAKLRWVACSAPRLSS
jgi:hypothetical protein